MSVDRLAEALRGQAEACAGLGSPFMAQLCRVLADRLEPGTALTDRLFGWEGDLSPRAESVPLRLWPGDHHIALAWADFHGRWVRWDVADEGVE